MIDNALIKDFFENRGFIFGSETSDIKPNVLIISEDQTLTDKLCDKVFVYDSPLNTRTSFYVINAVLSEEELFKVRRYIWNQDQYDLYFTFDKDEESFIATLFYAKASPKEKEDRIKIASFRGNEKDVEKIEEIKKSKFESGSFWLSYYKFLKEINKTKKVDKKLIETLTELKDRLFRELSKNKTENITEIVQALIDRTLFIKFLEDNHIINSFFYKYYFGSNQLNYKEFLKDNKIQEINRLFSLINEIFNNFLFKEPFIEDKYLSKNILNSIYEMITQKDWKTGQLSLFDFRFDVIPIEFISSIYEVFLEKKQKDQGIFYTPKNLAQIIVDDTITKTGSVLDPSCGSGMFLVLAFRKLLEFKPVKSDNAAHLIEYKNKLLKNYIFGIEKQDAALRIAVFSLYLELLRGIKPQEIKNLIKYKLETDNSAQIFPYDFSDNIKTANSLETEHEKIPHENKTFDYIVGNPPFLQIDKTSQTEWNFTEKYRTEIDEQILTANKLVGDKQISQCFMLKIKDWAKTDTRFGFVINSSNFYNEKSIKFQKFFFEYYQIEKFYELSKVKEILFPESRESVSVVIFNNCKIDKNTFDYYPVELGIFSEILNLLIIQEDKSIEINQQAILNEETNLRDYLIGNEFDRKLINKLSDNNKLEEYRLKVNFRGLERAKNTVIADYFDININDYNTLSNKEKNDLHEKFANQKYLNPEKTDYYNTPYIYKAGNVNEFRVKAYDGYMNENDIKEKNFRRGFKDKKLFYGNKILFNRFGDKIKSALIIYKCFFSTYLYVIKLQDQDLYPLFTAILNSDLVNYFLNLKYRDRIEDNYPNLNTISIKNIPIPKRIDDELNDQITEISLKLTNGEYKYEGEIKDKLNDLIFDLYDLGYLEKTRIKDFFYEKREVNETDLEEYKQSLIYTLELYFENQPVIQTHIEKSLPVGLVVAGIYFNKAEKKQPTGKHAGRFIINQILKENPEEKFLAMREKIFGKDCVYIVKNTQYQSWTKTKSYEDGQEILKRLKVGMFEVTPFSDAIDDILYGTV